MSSRALFLLGFLAFALIGALQAVYGPSFDALTRRFGVSRDVVGLIASTHFLGTMVGVLAGGVLLARFGLRFTLRGGAALLVAGLAVVVVAATWPLALAGAAVAGLGFGLVSVTFNVGFARLGAGAASALNVLNACFGLGAVAAPLLVAGLGGAYWPYVILGGMSLVLLAGAGRLPELPEVTPAGGPARVNTALLAGFALLFVVYVGVEAGLGAWLTTHLQASGVAGAAAWTSAFWLTVTMGRVLAAPLAQRVPLATLVIAAASVAALALPFAATSFAPIAYLVAGLAIAPIFGTSLAWFSRVFPTRLAPIVMACGGLGGTLFPALLGLLAGRVGAAVLPFAFALTALGVVVVALVLHGVTRRSVAVA